MSNSPKTPRRDAVLKNIPAGDPRREQIAEWLAADGWESCAQQCFSQLAIAVNGQPVSRNMIYEAVRFWRQQEHFETMQQRAMDQARLEAERQGGMTAAQLEEATDRSFIALAASTVDLENPDFTDYKELRFLRIRDQESKGNARIAEAKLLQKDKQLEQAEKSLAMAQRKLELLEAKAKEATEVAHDSKLTPAQQAERMREIFKRPA
jgi:hypothetical protein